GFVTDRLGGFLSLAQKFSVRLNRLALVCRDAGSHDWHCSGRITTNRRSLYLPASDWLVHPGYVGRDGGDQQLAAQTRSISCRLPARNRSAGNAQLFPRCLLEKQRDTLETYSCCHPRQLHRPKQPWRHAAREGAT